MAIGCAQYVAGEPLTRSIGRADEAVYRAKRAGRTRVLVARAAPGPASTAERFHAAVGASSLTGAG